MKVPGRRTRRVRGAAFIAAGGALVYGALAGAAITFDSGEALAQSIIFGDAIAGRRLARTACAACHAVEPADTDSPLSSATPFSELARDQSVTPADLRATLENPHDPMAQVILSAEEQRNSIAYILALRTDALEGGTGFPVASLRGELRIAGPVRVVEPSVIAIGDQNLRLFGIIAPSGDEICRNEPTAREECGLTALGVTIATVQGASFITCDLREVGVRELRAACRGDDLDTSGLDTSASDIAEVLIRKGVARPDERANVARYRLAELDARRARRGFWKCTAATPRGWERDKATLCG